MTDIANSRGLAVVPLLALTSTDARVALGCARAGGFIYCVSVLGVTGARAAVSGRVSGLVEKVRQHSRLPVGVGFGISKPEHVAEAAQFADGAVVGSALIDVIGRGTEDGAAERAGKFIKSLVPGTRKAAVPK